MRIFVGNSSLDFIDVIYLCVTYRLEISHSLFPHNYLPMCDF